MFLLKFKQFRQLRACSQKAKCPVKIEEPAQIQCEKGSTPPKTCKPDDSPCPPKKPLKHQVCPPYTNYLVYKVLSLILAFPLILTATYVLTKKEEPEDDEPPPPPVKYSYMGRITKKFPWKDGVTPLFSKPAKEIPDD